MSDETVRIDDGGPAFPRVVTELVNDVDLNENFPETYSVGGMSLRDYFAAKAMQGHLAHGAEYATWQAFAEDAYAMADAMLAARKAGGK